MKEAIMTHENLTKRQVHMGECVHKPRYFIHFSKPKVQASLTENIVTIAVHHETKRLTEMLPSILKHHGADSLTSLRRLSESLPKNSVYAIEENDDYEI
ncbi:Transcription factor BTF3, partial [Galemys pyrenaicus]